MKESKFIAIILSLFLFACKDDDTVEPVTTGEATVLIVNEGNFGFGNASLSLYNPTSNEVNQKIFQVNNNGRPIGDVAQSATVIDDRIFIVVNHSNKIEVVNRSDFNSVGSIKDLNSPRYILPISPTKAYVSDLYEDKIYIINPQTLAVSGTIESKGWTEEMTLINNKAFVCHADSNQVWVIDVTTDEVIHKINTHIEPLSIRLDQNNQLWLRCSGGLNSGQGVLYKIDPLTFEVKKIITTFHGRQKLGQIEIDKNGHFLYCLIEGDIYRYKIDDTDLPTLPFIKGANRLFYDLGYDSVNHELYVCDAIDYLQRGVVTRYNTLGEEGNTFKVGIIPGNILFLDQ